MPTNQLLLDVLRSIHNQSCPENINFHCHTTSSDGSLDPIQLIKQASSLGLEHFAITDHHSVQGYIQVERYLEESKYSISPTILWTGVEISCLLKGCLVHVIGLGFDIHSQLMHPYFLGEAATGPSLKAENVINAINKANGVSILAHPARYRIDYKTLIHEAHMLGMDGVEAWYDYNFSSKWSPSLLICESINQVAKKYNMMTSCGTDTHGYSLLGR